MKNDYTYIVLLDKDSAEVVRNIQKKLTESFGPSEYIDQWLPHSTISFSNLLSEDELEEFKNECTKIASDHHTFKIRFEKVSLIKKEIRGNVFYSLRLNIEKNDALESLSNDMVELARKYEVPLDKFTADHGYVALARYTEELDEEKIKSIIGHIENLPQPTISSFSIFYSMLNDPKPDKAKEIATFNFS